MRRYVCAWPKLPEVIYLLIRVRSIQGFPGGDPYCVYVILIIITGH